ncbi:MAG TPA: DUF4865 family protein [Acidiphilium sp.]
MIAMQYSIVLPADYDMAIIRRRIAERGHLLDDFPGLGFKAYLHASRDDAELPGRDNLYAPFYLWRNHEGMNAFLFGDGFAGLTGAFGRPAVRTWVPWAVEMAADLRAASVATREAVPIAEGCALNWLREEEIAAAEADRAEGALAAVSGYDPGGWSLMRFRLWPDTRPDLAREGRQLYRVGHISQPGARP